MPELPEVQTIANQLQKEIVGKKIKTVNIRLAKMVFGISPKKFLQTVVGTKIKSITRRAKVLIINLSNNYSLLIHLKLSGQVIYQPKNFIKLDKHSHIIYYFTDGSVLLHNDTRQFGWVKLIKTSELEKYFQTEKIGPEPLDKNFTLAEFRKLLSQKKSQKIKPLLMDQRFVAGIGNIYAQESCFCAKILPTRVVKTLKEKEIKDLYFCLLNILKKAISCHGSSVDDYLDAQGHQGNYVCHLKVYDRLDKKCFRCSGIIKKMVLAGRGTYFCPKCQK
jgi:formamidopyrimidine-DNA glycosylase